MKLEEGMFVRLKCGTIDKLRKIEKHVNYYILKYDKGTLLSTSGHDDNVIKASYNIVDLIEVGDIVVINVIEENYEWAKGKWIYPLNDEQSIYEVVNSLCEFVKLDKILTKEQYECYCYKVGGELNNELH